MRALPVAILAFVASMAASRPADAQYNGRYGLYLTTAFSSPAYVGKHDYDWVGSNRYRSNWIGSWYAPTAGNSTRIRDEGVANPAAAKPSGYRVPAGFSGPATQPTRQQQQQGRVGGAAGGNRPQIPTPPVRLMPSRGSLR